MFFTTLMYHEIRKTDEFDATHKYHIEVAQSYDDILPNVLFVTLDNFEEQMKYLYENEYHTLSTDEIIDFYYNQGEIPNKSILLTFDDAYQSMKKYAYPILKKYNFKVLSFVVTGWLFNKIKEFNQNKSICLNFNDLTEISDVFDFANHTHYMHTRLNEKTSAIMFRNENAFIMDLNLCNSFEIINKKNVFAYPFGLYNDENIDTLKQNNFKLAFTSENGINDIDTNPLLLNRNVVPFFLSIDEFKKIVGEGNSN